MQSHYLNQLLFAEITVLSCIYIQPDKHVSHKLLEAGEKRTFSVCFISLFCKRSKILFGQPHGIIMRIGGLYFIYLATYVPVGSFIDLFNKLIIVISKQSFKSGMPHNLMNHSGFKFFHTPDIHQVYYNLIVAIPSLGTKLHIIVANSHTVTWIGTFNILGTRYHIHIMTQQFCHTLNRRTKHFHLLGRILDLRNIGQRYSFHLNRSGVGAKRELLILSSTIPFHFFTLNLLITHAGKSTILATLYKKCRYSRRCTRLKPLNFTAHKLFVLIKSFVLRFRTIIEFLINNCKQTSIG